MNPKYKPDDELHHIPTRQTVRVLRTKAVKEPGIYSVVTLDGRRAFDAKEGELREIVRRNQK